MPVELPFPHHTYTDNPAKGCFELIPATLAQPVANPQPGDTLGVAETLRRAGVVEIILLHGTFTGDDALGIMREIIRISPRAGRALKQRAKHLVDQWWGEVGNYSQPFADCLRQLINNGQQDAIPVEFFHWSGENHHLGRADGAIALLDRLLARNWRAGQRIQIWGHSHGGNLLALMTNILGASARARRRFFDATRAHYRKSFFSKTDLPAWQNVRQKLAATNSPGALLPRLDLVTFGTPLRYRWNVDAHGNLLHFAQHRPLLRSCAAQAVLPASLEDVLTARGGDYIQQFGIAGTDFLHNILAWRSWQVERRLRRLLEPGLRRRDLPEHLRQGQRVSLDGVTLLVDYAATPEGWERAMAGHAVYTCHEWLPFHLREIAARFYSGTPLMGFEI